MMNDITLQLKNWVEAAKKNPQQNSKKLIERLKIINTSPLHVKSKDMPPIG
jgi:hypothetical protein